MEDARAVVDNSYLTVHLGTTAEGKELWMARTPNCPVRKIAFKGGGQLPECLLGGFSTILIAKTAVEDYIQAKVDAGKKAKKTTGRSSK